MVLGGKKHSQNYDIHVDKQKMSVNSFSSFVICKREILHLFCIFKSVFILASQRLILSISYTLLSPELFQIYHRFVYLFRCVKKVKDKYRLRLSRNASICMFIQKFFLKKSHVDHVCTTNL